MADRTGVLDPRALRFGAVVTLVATAAGLLGAVAHHVIFFNANASSDAAVANVFTEGLIFLGVLLVGLPAATFLSVWRGRAYAASQGAVATVLGCALGLGLGGGVLTVLPGGSPEVFGLFFTLSPVYLCLQALAALAAWIGSLVRRRDSRTRQGSV
jgi:hypothetical protein